MEVQNERVSSHEFHPVDPLLFSEAFETRTVQCRFSSRFDSLRQSRSIRLCRLRQHWRGAEQKSSEHAAEPRNELPPLIE